MWQLLLKLLSTFGRIGLPAFPHRVCFKVGDPTAPDSEGGAEWKEMTKTRKLWEVWGPVPGRPWEPFHCVTLFAALDHLNGKLRPVLGPLAGVAPACLATGNQLPEWARQRDTLVILDLPGREVVAAGYALANRGDFQPVCTFDNWPNELGVIQSEKILGALLYFAAGISRLRDRMTTASPPVWLCDSERCLGRKPGPGWYDNRYIIEDRLLPGPAMLAAAGIHRVIYVGAAPPPIQAALDLDPYLGELKKKGLEVQAVSTASVESFATPGPLVQVEPKLLTDLSVGLVRASAGGFGGFVPHPSSSGG
jgi:hypothetical protein